MNAILVLGLVWAGCGSEEESSGAPTLSSATTIVASPTINALQDPMRLAAEIVENVPGFAGLAIDPDHDNSYVVQATVSDIDVEALKNAVLTVDPSLADSFQTATFRVAVLDFDTSLLNEWYAQLNEAVVAKLPAELSSFWVWSDLDEVHNQIVIGFADETARARAQQLILQQMDAPAGVIVAIPAVQGSDD